MALLCGMKLREQFGKKSFRMRFMPSVMRDAGQNELARSATGRSRGGLPRSERMSSCASDGRGDESAYVLPA
eukprot:2281896-Prymnesium_polylepis.1